MSRTFRLSSLCAADPLPSWRTGSTKSALIEFVTGALKIDGPYYVPHKRRIAAFDSDGTLWSERPIQFQVYFALDQLAALVKHNPSLGERLPFRTLLERNVKAISRLTKHEALEPVLAAYAGLTPEEFDGAVKNWFSTARHPMLGRLFKDCAYLPQLELLRYLRNSGFTSYVVSDGGAEFVRALAEEVYGIPAARVIGDVLKTRLVAKETETVLINRGELRRNDQRSGSRPILAFGNSDDDLPMLRYTLSGNGRRLALLLHHDDKTREFAYDREYHLCPLAKGLDRARDYGLTVVSMKRDWKRVFREPSEAFFAAPERGAFVGPTSNSVGLRPAL